MKTCSAVQTSRILFGCCSLKWVSGLHKMSAGQQKPWRVALTKCCLIDHWQLLVYTLLLVR